MASKPWQAAQPDLRVFAFAADNVQLLERLGVWPTMVISMWGSGFELIVDPFTKKKQGMIELTTFMLADVTLKYPQAFVVAQCQK